MDRRTTLALALCFLIFVGWQEFYIKPRTPAKRPVTTPSLATTSGGSSSVPATQGTTPSSSSPKAPAPATWTSARAATDQVLKNDKVAVTLSDTGLWIKGWSLSRFNTGSDPSAPAVELTHVSNQAGNLELAFDDPAYVDAPRLQGTFSTLPSGALEWKYEDARMRVRRVFSLSNDYAMSAQLSVEFLATPPKYAFISVGQSGMDHDPEQQDRQLLYWTENALSRLLISKATEIAQVHTPVRYIGAQNRYFLFGVLNASELAPKALVQPVGPSSAKLSLVYPISGNSITIPLKVYFGPKELTALRSTDPLLDHTVDFGWFTVIAYPILRLMKWLYGFVGNYGVAIILLTLLLKVVTYPLTYKSMKSMKQMARLQPQLQKLRERYKDDKEALNREMLTFMRGNGYNPIAGCLPILIQMPVFFALYRVLYSSIELLHAPFALWITDLAAHDRYYVTPVLLSVTMYIQQKLTPNTTMDPTQAKMLQLMPLIFGAFMLWLPSGLTLYMLVNALASIVQQIILNRKFQDSDAITPTAVLKAR